MLDDATRATRSVGEGVSCHSVNLTRTDRGDVDILKLIRGVSDIDLGAVYFRHIYQFLYLPALGNISKKRRDELDLFVAGKAEVDEPLAVEGAGHLLQNPYAPPIVLYQLVICRQNACYPPLHRKRRDTEVEGEQLIYAEIILRSPARHVLHLELHRIDEVFDKAHIRLFRIWNEADDAVREASGNSEQSRFSNICRYSYAECPGLPEFALRKPLFIVGL